MPSSKCLVATLALTLLPALAGAWTPYGDGPYQPVPGPSAPDWGDQGPGGPLGASSPSGPVPPSDRLGPPPPMTQPGGMRIQRSATDQAYLLTIQISGITPAEVRVEARGPSVLVTRDRSAEATQEESFSDGSGYRRSFSYSSGRASRRFNVPPDGDTAAMQRQDTDQAIYITIPRTAGQAAPR